MDTNIEQNLLKLKAFFDCLGCDLSGVDLRRADLTGANLRFAKLTRAKLSEAKIGGAIFCNTKTPWGLDNSGCKKE